MTKQKLAIRPLERKDIPLLAKWLSNPEVLAFYEGRDKPFNSQKVREVFFESPDSTQKCMFSYEGKPVGYVQYEELNKDEKREFGYEGSQQVYGMDQFIGEPAYWNRGIGTVLVQRMIRFLTEENQASVIVMDPQAWNERALRCYEKCGFRKVKFLPKHEWHEGNYRDCWLIEWKGDAYAHTIT